LQPKIKSTSLEILKYLSSQRKKYDIGKEEEMKMTTSSYTQRTWKPTTGGILSIIAGAINLFIAIILVSVSRYDIWEYTRRFRDAMGFERMGIALGIILIILAIAAIVGGIFAILRRIWGLSLAGAICSLVPHPGMILGIPALIFVSMSRDEFD
jgi:hypothetical protein